jgi:hypothetical protein
VDRYTSSRSARPPEQPPPHEITIAAQRPDARRAAITGAALNAERKRLRESDQGKRPWKLWGPYLGERQWSTVREDYSPDGSAWEYFPFEHSRSRAYRWGEDGLLGVSDERQRLCFSVALWNGLDPMLKRSFFGLTGNEGNHGEDVKEVYYYLDSTPTHSYMRALYKYPHTEFPYETLRRKNRENGKDGPEFELLDTGVFDEDRYFDVFIEYAKAGPDDLLIRVTAHNRGPDPAPLEIIPTLWFRNTWSWKPGSDRPVLNRLGDSGVEAQHPEIGRYELRCDGSPELLFCDNDTNHPLIFAGKSDGYFKDAINDYIVAGRADAVNPDPTGTRVGARYQFLVEPGSAATVELRLANRHARDTFADFDENFQRRRNEADEFYAELQAQIDDPDIRSVQRQALAGMLWSKQFYRLEMPEWLNGDPGQPPPPPGRRQGRNRDWEHLYNADIISMPDKWEYPWYAAWDLAFHCLPLAMVDAEFAKSQLVLLTREWYMHPNGQLPAYEWGFSDVNPPVHAWATWRVYQMDRKQRGGEGDIAFLERVFHKLLLNFTWWVNRKDKDGNNLFQGGFLGLDNIGVFDRGAELPLGGFIEQADGTSWMAMYSLNLLRISLELARHNPVYQDVATKFFEHFLSIAAAMANVGDRNIDLWDDDDEFFYDVLHFDADSDGSTNSTVMKVRSMVGLIPLFAVETLEPDLLEQLPEFKQRMDWFLENRPDLATLVSRWHEPGLGERSLLSLLRGHRMKRLLVRMLDESEFLSDYGVRSLSKHHLDHPYVLDIGGTINTLTYEPAESRSNIFGGNSNWRGPIWFPLNLLIIESLQKFHHYYGDDFRVECPTGSGKYLTLDEVAAELARRLGKLFLRNSDGRRAIFGQNEKFQTDPHFRDHLLFHEFFDGDTGRGLGASHQTGWTGTIAKLLHPRRA